MRGRAAAALALAIGLLIAACGGGAVAVTTIATTTTRPAATSTTIRSELVPGSTTACASDDPWGSVETAFEGTISSVETRPNSDRAGLQFEFGEEPSEEASPWVTFEVSRWYTRDYGTTFSMWAPGFTGEVGEVWLVAGSLYHSEGQQSGEIFPCLTAPPSFETETELAERYGEPVTAGSGTPEKPADTDIITRIEEHQAAWDAAGIDDYTAVISMHHGNEQVFDDSCGANTSVRVVVRDGEPVQAIDLQRFCEVEVGDLVLIDDLFALATANAGAIEEPINFDQEYGFIRYFYASDRSVETGATVDMFQPRPVPAAIGSGSSIAAMNDAFERWSQAGIEDYSFDLDVVCFCTIGGRFHIVVEDGIPISVTENGGEIAIETSEFIEFTIDGLFDLAETWGGGLEPDRLVASFDPDLGYPVDLRIDAISEAIDDEVTVVVHNFTRGD
jgi:hypothetical protein